MNKNMYPEADSSVAGDPVVQLVNIGTRTFNFTPLKNFIECGDLRFSSVLPDL